MGSYNQNRRRTSVATSTINYYQTTISMAILKDALRLSSAKTLVYPFKLDTWIVLIFICTVVTPSAHLIKYCRKSNSRISIISGKATMDIFLMALGMPAICTPRGNGVRILNISWMFFTLVVRGIYQGFLFHMIRTHIIVNPPGSLDAMLNMGLSTVMTKRVQQLLVDYSDMGRTNMIVLDSPEENASLAYLESDSKKHTKYTVAISPLDFFQYDMHINHKTNVFKILTHPVMDYKICIYLAKHSYLIDQLDEVLVWIRGSGLMAYWKNLQYDTHRSRTMSTKEDDLFSLSELSGAFMLMIVGHLLAISVFIGELLYRKFLGACFDK